MNLALSILIVTVSCVFGGLAGVLMKKGADRLKLNIPALMKNKYLIGGLAIYAVGTIIYVIALKGADLSIMYPLVSMTYIWVCLFSQKFLNEKMNRYKWIGIAFILVGVSLIGLGIKWQP